VSTSTAIERFLQNYRPAFMAFVAHQDEEHLHAGYELGRGALTDGITLIDLVRTHDSVFVALLETAGEPAERQQILDAAAAFLVEAVAPYEMARRGFFENALPRGFGSP
jgi:hypothetical protein